MDPLPTGMRASVRTGTGPLETSLTLKKDLPLPAHGANLPEDHVLIKVSFASLNPLDFKVAETPLLRQFFKGVPGLDFAGIVVQSNSKDFAEGMRVYGQTQPMNFGACAEFATVAAIYCMKVPDDLKLEYAATIGIAGLTAYSTLAPFVKKGDKVLINGGSGGVGIFGVQIAKLMGCFVTTTCSGANVDLCKSLGADQVIDYRTQNVVETLQRNGWRYDLIVDNVFADANLYWYCHHYLQEEGKFVTIAGGPTWSFIRNFLACSLLPSFLGGGYRAFQFTGRKNNAQWCNQIATWIKDGDLKVIIQQVYDIENTNDAFRQLKSGKTRGKILVKVAK